MRTYPHPLGEINLVESEDDLKPVRDLLASTTTIAGDTENTGLDMYADDFRNRVLQVASADRSFVIPAELVPLILDLLFSRPVWWHNRTYDLLVMETQYGVPFAKSAPLGYDTGILSRVLDPRPKHWGGWGHGLDDLGAALLGIDDKGAASKALLSAGRKLKLKTKATVFRYIPVDTPEYVIYAGGDPMITARLARVLTRMVKERGLGDVVKLEHRIAYNLAQITRNGIAYDHEWSAKARGEYERDLAEAEGELRDRWGIQPGGQWAHKAIPQLVQTFKQAGVTSWPSFTATGREQLTQGVLKGFAAHHKPAVRALAALVREAQEARHFAGYVEGFEGAIGRDGRVHPVVSPLAAVTGRMSISNPPLQQIPKKDKRLRGCYVADDGHVLISADYKNMEVRAAAALCHDENLIGVIMRGEDPYAPIAEILGGPEWDTTQESKDHYRSMGKVGILGPMYGSGPETLSRQLSIPLDTAVEVRDAVNTAYPGLAKTARRMAQHVEAGHEDAYSFTGRPLKIDPKRAYTALNTLCQGPCRDVMALAVNDMADAGVIDYLRLVVHDEADVSAPEADAEEIMHVVERCMYQDFRGVPMEADAVILGKRWRKA